jgi:hypothetical protein
MVLLAMMVAFIGHSLMNFTLQLPTSSLLFVGLIAVAAAFDRETGGFPLTVRSDYPGVSLDLETTEMRRIESVGLCLRLPPTARGAFAGIALVLALIAVGNSIRPLAADVYFNEAKQLKMAAELRPGPSPETSAALGLAESLARRALALNPDHHTARKLLGRVLLATGRNAEARAALEKVRERETVFDYFKELGFACWNLSDREAAGEAWATYFRRCPSMQTADAAFFAFFKKEFPERAAALQSTDAP